MPIHLIKMLSEVAAQQQLDAGRPQQSRQKPARFGAPWPSAQRSSSPLLPPYCEQLNGHTKKVDVIKELTSSRCLVK